MISIFLPKANRNLNAMDVNIALKCVLVQKQNFLSGTVQIQKWMVIMMASHVKSSGAGINKNPAPEGQVLVTP